ncbi:MAG: DUF58 domain-containing protein, partial [Patescibacteria group bacterium]|nr:DUF58 domain-containing protein [Patescibacteria group bacterium]
MTLWPPQLMSDDCNNAALPALDAQWLTRYRCLSLAARPWSERSLVRPTRHGLPAGGTEATGVRDYSPGDELRWIDWKWCARRDEVLTRTFEGRQDRPMTVLLDISRSMAEDFTGGPLGQPAPGLKFRMAQRLAAAAGCAALDAMAVFRLVPFSGSLCPGPPPLRDRWRVLRLLRFIERLAPDDSPTDLGNAVAALVRQPGCRG